jgi:ferredoxin
VEDIRERRTGDLTVRIDRLICVGFGDCIDGGAGAFELDDEGIAVFTASIDSVEPAVLVEACRSCPVDAISVIGPGGEQLVP